MKLCSAFALVLSLLPVRALAQSTAPVSDRSVANDSAARGRAAFEQRDFFAATELLCRAVALDPAPLSYLYLARAHAAQNQLLEAAEDYRHALAAPAPADVSPSNEPVAEEARHELTLLEGRIPTVTLAPGDIEQHATGVRIALDGQVGAIPGHAISLNPGRHEISATADGGLQARATFEVGEHESKTVRLAWHTNGVRAQQGQSALSNASSGARRTWGIVALGVGATGLGIGTVTGVAALTRYSAAEQSCPAGRCTQGAQYPDDGSAFRALRTISAAGYVVGVAGVGTWLGLLLTAPTANPEHPHVTPWTPVVGMGSAGARYAF